MFMYFPFDHAVQTTYDKNNNITSQETVTSGNVKFGYEKRSGGSGTDPDPIEVKHYDVELYFSIPDDAYKYVFGYKGFWFRESNVSVTADYVKHEYYDDYNYSPSRHGVKDTTGTADFNNTYSIGNVFIYTDLLPGDYNLHQGDLSKISFSEYVVNRIQADNYNMLKIRIVPPYDSFDNPREKYYNEITYLYTLSLDNLNFGMDAWPISLIVNPVYPVDVYARDDRDLTVDWDFSNSQNRSSTYLYQASNSVTITDKDGHTAQKGVSSGTDSQVTFTASDLSGLSLGPCTVNVLVTSNYGTTGTADFGFELIGESDAPEITSISQNSYPTITWTSSNQISWELQISDSSGIVYKSGMQIGNDQSFTVPILLEDGGYSVELRYVNTYGSLSMWASSFVNLQPTKPSAPQNIIVSPRNDFGISVRCGAMQTTGKLLVVRRKDENSTPVVLGEYNGSFVDYLIGLNDYHQYTVRNYVQGYADGDWVDGAVIAQGCIIRSADDYSKFVHIWKTEDNIPDYTITETKSDVLMNCVGRKYPITEIGEWLSSERSFSGHVTDEDFKKLIDMRLNSSHILLQADKEYMPCSMDIADRGQYIDQGRIASLKLIRIDGEK